METTQPSEVQQKKKKKERLHDDLVNDLLLSKHQSSHKRHIKLYQPRWFGRILRIMFGLFLFYYVCVDGFFLQKTTNIHELSFQHLGWLLYSIYLCIHIVHVFLQTVYPSHNNNNNNNNNSSRLNREHMGFNDHNNINNINNDSNNTNNDNDNDNNNNNNNTSLIILTVLFCMFGICTLLDIAEMKWEHLIYPEGNALQSRKDSVHWKHMNSLKNSNAHKKIRLSNVFAFEYTLLLSDIIILIHISIIAIAYICIGILGWPGCELNIYVLFYQWCRKIMSLCFGSDSNNNNDDDNDPQQKYRSFVVKLKACDMFGLLSAVEIIDFFESMLCRFFPN